MSATSSIFDEPLLFRELKGLEKFKYWLLFPVWTIHQAVYLSLGLDPEFVCFSEENREMLDDPKAPETAYRNLQQEVNMRTKQLKCVTQKGLLSEDKKSNEINPFLYIKWAQVNGVYIYLDLVSASDSLQKTIESNITDLIGSPPIYSVPVKATETQPFHKNKNEQERSSIPSTKKKKSGRPSYDWASFNIEMERRKDAGELPPFMNSCAASMGDWCEKTWGKDKRPKEISLYNYIKAFYISKV